MLERGVAGEVLVREHREHTAETELGDVLERVDGGVQRALVGQRTREVAGGDDGGGERERGTEQRPRRGCRR